MKHILFLFSFSILLFAKFNITSIKSDFTQTITNDQNQTIIYHGKFYARDDNDALWVYNKPIKKLLYFLQGKVVIIEPNLEQVIFSKLEKIPKILNILKKAKHKDGKLIAVCCGNTYYIKIEDNKIKTVKYLDKIGNKVTIKFYNEDTNLILGNDIFKYKIPEGYDILEN